MNLLKHIWVLLFFTETDAEKDRILSRKRRFLAFPDGSSFAASACMTIGVIGNPVLEYLSYAINWGVAYDLPNQTWIRQHKHGFSNSLSAHDTKIKSRYRRDLYENIELAMDNMGFNGRECIERTLCESSDYLRADTGNMVEEIIKTVFRFPGHGLSSAVDEDANHYDEAYRRGRSRKDCQKLYPNCHFSLLELALGKYSVEPTKHGTRFFKFM